MQIVHNGTHWKYRRVEILKPHAVVAVIVGFCMTLALFLLQRAMVFIATTGFK